MHDMKHKGRLSAQKKKTRKNDQRVTWDVNKVKRISRKNESDIDAGKDPSETLCFLCSL